MIDVWCVLWGDKYPDEYVYILRRMVTAHLSMPHRFMCITDKVLPGIATVRANCHYHGWWQKLQLFEPGRATRTSLYLDLDVVITGELDSLVRDYGDCDLAMPANWAQSGHGGCQSSVMIWRGNTSHDLWTDFRYEVDSRRLWGDQEFITEKYGNPGGEIVTGITPCKIVSYKYHCRTGLPRDARIVVFHGEPKPHDVDEGWVHEHRLPLQRHNGTMSMRDGCMSIVYHCNATQPHQREHGRWLQRGFESIGYPLIITTDIHRDADIHVVSGPHYARDQWIGYPRVISIDRAYYHAENSGQRNSMDWVSLGWLNADGSRRFFIDESIAREPVVIQNNAAESGTIFLADFDTRPDQIPQGITTLRLHPANCGEQEPLIDALRRHRAAVGYRTSALVDAAMEGLSITVLDSTHILARSDWMEILPYADWHYSEIESGVALGHLMRHMNEYHHHRSASG